MAESIRREQFASESVFGFGCGQRDTSLLVMLIGFQEQSQTWGLVIWRQRFDARVTGLRYSTSSRIRRRSLPRLPRSIRSSASRSFFSSTWIVSKNSYDICEITASPVISRWAAIFPALAISIVSNGVPDIDSIVRFEGEMTLIELSDHISTGRDWRGITGIAYQQSGEIVANELRPLVPDLESWPILSATTLDLR